MKIALKREQKKGKRVWARDEKDGERRGRRDRDVEGWSARGLEVVDCPKGNELELAALSLMRTARDLKEGREREGEVAVPGWC